MLDLNALRVMRGFRIRKRGRVAMLLMTTGYWADWSDIQHIERLGYIRLEFYI